MDVLDSFIWITNGNIDLLAVESKYGNPNKLRTTAINQIE